MKNEEKQDLTNEKKISLGRKSSRYEVWREREVIGKVRGQKVSREIERIETEIALILYIEIHKSQQIERCQELLRIKTWGKSYRESIERCLQQKGLDGSRNYRVSIEHTETSSMDQESIKKLSRLR